MTEVVLRPLRFTADVKAMQAFLETLGLRPRVEGERGGWVDLLAGSGMVALHDSASSTTGGQPGDTRLTFEADDIDVLKERLVEAGFEDATTWDEAYGRVLRVTAPDQMEVWVDERSEDLYGYKLHDAKPDPRLSVAPYLTGATEADWRRFLGVLGTEQPASYGPGEGEFAVRMDFRTTEAPAEVATRLTDAGYTAVLEGDDVVVTDPDGLLVRVHG